MALNLCSRRLRGRCPEPPSRLLSPQWMFSLSLEMYVPLLHYATRADNFNRLWSTPRTRWRNWLLEQRLTWTSASFAAMWSNDAITDFSSSSFSLSACLKLSIICKNMPWWLMVRGQTRGGFASDYVRSNDSSPSSTFGSSLKIEWDLLARGFGKQNPGPVPG